MMMMSIEHGYTNPGRLIFLTMTPDTCRASVWLSYLVPFIAPRILWWLLDFGKICGPPRPLCCIVAVILTRGRRSTLIKPVPVSLRHKAHTNWPGTESGPPRWRLKYVHCLYIKVQSLPNRKHSLFELEMPFGAYGCHLWEEIGTCILFGQKVIRGGTYVNHEALKRTSMRAVWHAGVCLSEDPSLVGKEAVSVCIRRLRGAGFML